MYWESSPSIYESIKNEIVKDIHNPEHVIDVLTRYTPFWFNVNDLVVYHYTYINDDLVMIMYFRTIRVVVVVYETSKKLSITVEYEGE